MQPIPEGDYTLEVNLTSEDKSVASLSTQITIGAVPQKVLSRFSPTHYFDKMKAYADDLRSASIRNVVIEKVSHSSDISQSVDQSPTVIDISSEIFVPSRHIFPCVPIARIRI